MRNPSTPALPSSVPHQLNLALDSVRLRGMSPTERSTALARLADLLMEAAGIAAEERNDDGR
jgi:hypothetical protein